MKLNDGSEWNPEQADLEQWTQLYPAVDVEQEIRAMTGWLDANPTRRKTSRGIKRFVNSWLARAQDKGGSPMARAAQSITPGGKIRARDMTSLDELTHNFTRDPAMREYFIRKHGQCFEDGVRYNAIDGSQY